MLLKNIVRVWNEELFYLNRKEKLEVISDLKVRFVPITLENLSLVENLRGKRYIKQFKKQIAYGDFGYYAYVEGKPIAYGWVKHKGSKDYFFKIEKNICYLCRFFTHVSVRGHNIYPLLILELIKHEKEYESFYIDIEEGNFSSERGLIKVGFKKIKKLRFFRIAKKTINKYVL